MSYKTDIDFNRLKTDTEFDDIVSYVRENFYKPTGTAWKLKKISKLLRLICTSEGIEPSPEQYVYILCNYPRILNEACAGAGKTTMSKYKMLLANICYGIPGNNILAICYNKHAATDIESKYQKTARKFNNAMKGTMHIDTNICATTFHAWCLSWVKEYRGRWGFKNIKLMSETDVNTVMTRCVNIFSKKNPQRGNIFVSESMIASLIQLNNYIHETLTENEPEEWQMSSSFSDLKMFTVGELISIFETYKRAKELSKFVDYQDLVNLMWELVSDPKINERFRYVYKYVVVDEYQDITPAMVRIIKMLMQGDLSLGIPYYEEGRLTVIGDGDQSIYGFRGTDSDNCIRFRNDYASPDGSDNLRITAMSINRRCSKNILDCARKIITSNSNRIDKPINGLHEGGEVITSKYTNEVNETTQIIELLQSVLNEKDRNYSNTCICYRNIASSQYLVMKLLQANIPMKIARGMEPFSDIYCQTLEGVLTILEHPKLASYAKTWLYRAVPRGQGFTKENLGKIFQKQIDLESQAKRGQFIESKYFWEYDYGDWYMEKGFREAIEQLRRAHIALVSGQPMRNYINIIISLVRTYYIDGLRKGVMKDKFSDHYIAYIESYFNSNLSYRDFKVEKENRIRKYQDESVRGVYLTTMHGLKGLEFDNVIVIDLQDTLFPGNELKGSNLTPEQQIKIELEARRLLYVTVTRAKKYANLFFHETCPSRYIKFFIENDNIANMYEGNVTQSLSISPESQATLKTIISSFGEDEFVFEDDVDTSQIVEPNKLTDLFSMETADSSSFLDCSDLDFSSFEDDNSSDIELNDEEEEVLQEDKNSPLYGKPRLNHLMDMLKSKELED